MSKCMHHPGEVRAPRFDYLNALIEAGWGNVSMERIEAAIERNGGVLPAAPSPAEETDEWTAALQAARDRRAPAKHIIVLAVAFGFETSAEVAAVTGFGKAKCSAFMNQLWSEGKLVRTSDCSRTPGRGGRESYRYRLVSA
jgi:hypothetical protein